MELLDLADIFPVSLQKNAQFSSLGLLTHRKPQLLSFIENEKYLPLMINNPNITAVITTPKLANSIPETIGLVICDIPRKQFFLFHNHLASNTDFYWKSFPTQKSPKASISPLAYIAEKDVVIEEDVIIEPFVSIYERVIIEKGTVIRSGATIGSDGFEFCRLGDGLMEISHAGGVHLGERVQVQSHANVDRSVFGGFTKVGRDTKISKYSHIAHHAVIGQRCLIAAKAIISGSTVIGDDVWVGPGSTISSQLNIGDKAKISLGSVVTCDVAEGQWVSGNFAVDHEKYLDFVKSIR
jgi:UDP-3-O-[3-hydroxymyristoyl] glucosamine N-acyltransferase